MSHCNVLGYMLVRYILLPNNVSRLIVLSCNVLRYIVSRYNVLRYIVLLCSVLQYIDVEDRRTPVSSLWNFGKTP